MRTPLPILPAPIRSPKTARPWRALVFACFAVSTAACSPVLVGVGVAATVGGSSSGGGNPTGVARLEVRIGTESGPLIVDGSAAEGALDFGLQSRDLGATTPLKIVILNSGSADLTVLGVTNDNGSDFVTDLSGLSPLPIAPGESSFITLAFDPASVGLKTATIRLQSAADPTNLEHVFSVSGVGIAPKLEVHIGSETGPLVIDGSVATGPLNFGLRDRDSGATQPQRIVLLNSGSAPLTVTGVSVDNALDFVTNLSGLSPLPIAPGDSTSFALAFDPAGAGVKSATIRLQTNADVSNPEHGFGLSGVGSVATVEFATASSSTASEVAGTLGIEAVFKSDSPVSATRNLEVFDIGTGSAQSGADYVGLTPTLVSFPAGSVGRVSRIIPIQIVQDSSVEGDETIRLGVRFGNTELGTQQTHEIIIRDDETLGAVFFAGSDSQIEESSGAPGLTVKLILGAGVLGNPVSLTISDAGLGTATSGVDYAAVFPATVTFPVGSADGSLATFVLPVLQDSLIEGDETVELRLGPASGPALQIGLNAHTITLIDDERPTVTVPGFQETLEDVAGFFTINNAGPGVPQLSISASPSGSLTSVSVQPPTGGVSRVDYQPASGFVGFVTLTTTAQNLAGRFTGITTLRIVENSPVFSDPGPQTGTEDTAGSFLFGGILPLGTTPTFTVTSPPATLSSLSVRPAVVGSVPVKGFFEVTFSPASGFVGATTVTITASNATSQSQISVPLEIVRLRPSFQRPLKQLAFKNGAGRFFVTGITPGGVDTPVISIEVARPFPPSVLTSLSNRVVNAGRAEVNFTVGNFSGDLRLKITATNSHGSVDRKVDLSVQDGAPLTPLLDNPGSQLGYPGITGTIPIADIRPADSRIRLSGGAPFLDVSASPAAGLDSLTVSEVVDQKATISYTANAQFTGQITVLLTATNAAGIDSVAFPLSIQSPAQPQLGDPGPQIILAGRPLEFTLPNSAPENPPLEFQYSVKPLGSLSSVVAAPVTGGKSLVRVISGVGFIGSASLTITGRNSSGEASVTVPIDVRRNQPPSIDTPGPQNGTINTLKSVVLTGIDTGTGDGVAQIASFTVTCSDFSILESAAVGPGATGNATLRLLPRPDRVGVVTVTVTIDDNQASDSSRSVQFPFEIKATPPQVSAVTVPPGTQGDLVPITFTLVQAESQPVDVTIEFEDANKFFRPAIQGGSDPIHGFSGLRRLRTSPAGVQHRFLWHSERSLPAQRLTTRIRVRASLAGLSAGPLISVPTTVETRFRFGTPSELPLGSSSALDVALADLDRNGLVDLVALESTSPSLTTISIRRRDPSAPGKYLAAQELPVGGRAQSLLVHDLNADGSLDIAVAETTKGGVMVFLQSQSAPGTFLPRVLYDVAGEPRRLAVGDFNGDGRVDLALVTRSPSFTLVFFQNFSIRGIFVAPIQLATGLSFEDIAAADLNHDGLTDLVTADSAGALTVHRQSAFPAGTFAAATTLSIDRPLSLTAGDLDGDGEADLVVGSVDRLSVFIQDGRMPSGFAARRDVNGASGLTRVAQADLNGDKSPDIVALSSTGAVTYLQDTRRPGEFALATSLSLGTTALALGDYDQDGDQDIVLGADSKLQLVANLEARRRDAAWVLPENVGAIVGIGDVDKDGKVDLIINSSPTTSLRFGRGDGSFAAPTPISLPAQSSLSSLVAIQDVNDDGLNDLVARGVVYLQNPVLPGTFLSRSLGFNSTGASLLVDLDTDGNLDVLSSDEGFLNITRRNAAKSSGFDDPLRIAPGRLTEMAVVADLDGRNGLDIALLGAQSLTVLLHGKALSFRSQVIGVGSIDSLVNGDFNGDGRTDLALTNDQRVSVFFQDSLQPVGFRRLDIPLPGRPRALVAVDFNGDGATDLVVENELEITVLQQSSQNPGTFPTRVALGIGQATGQLIAGDFDGDGALDVFALATDAVASVLIRRDPSAPSGYSLTPDSDLGTITSGLRRLSEMDFNEDGRGDLVLTGSKSLIAISQPVVAPELGRNLRSQNGVILSDIVATGDLDGDRQPDVIAADNFDSLAFLLGDRDGRALLKPPTSLSSGTITQATIVDVDRDGLRDIVAIGRLPRFLFEGRVFLHFQRPGLQFSPVQLLTVGKLPTELKVLDVNRDGLVDIVTLDHGADQLGVILQDPLTPGQFLAAQSLPVGDLPVGLVVTDINGDGRPDLVCTSQSATTGISGEVSIFFQDPNSRGVFLPESKFALGSGLSPLAVGDVDGDSRPDMIATNGSRLVLTLQSGAPGAFAAPVNLNLPLLQSALEVRLVDLNVDGKLDIVTANSFTLMLQDSSNPGKFLAPLTLNSGPTVGFELRDITGDGLLDLTDTRFGAVHQFVQSENKPGVFELERIFQIRTSFDNQETNLLDLSGDGISELMLVNADQRGLVGAIGR